MREGSPPTTRFDKAMFMTWPAARSALSPPAVQNDLPGKALPGRLAHVLERSRRTATPGGGERRYRAPQKWSLRAGWGDRIQEVPNGMPAKDEFKADHLILFVGENPFFAPLLGVESRPRAPAPATVRNGSGLLN